MSNLWEQRSGNRHGKENIASSEPTIASIDQASGALQIQHDMRKSKRRTMDLVKEFERMATLKNMEDAEMSTHKLFGKNGHANIKDRGFAHANAIDHKSLSLRPEQNGEVYIASLTKDGHSPHPEDAFSNENCGQVESITHASTGDRTDNQYPATSHPSLGITQNRFAEMETNVNGNRASVLKDIVNEDSNLLQDRALCSTKKHVVEAEKERIREELAEITKTLRTTLLAVETLAQRLQ